MQDSEWQKPTSKSPFTGRKRGEIEVERAIESDEKMNDTIQLLEELVGTIGHDLLVIREIEDKDEATKEFLALERRIERVIDIAVDKQGLNRILIYIEGKLEAIIGAVQNDATGLDHDTMVFIGFLTIIGTSAAAVHKQKQQQKLEDVVDELAAISGAQF